MCLTNFAGIPTYKQLGKTSPITRLQAPITEFSPITQGSILVALLAIPIPFL
jgi:hypothetical protein